LNAADRPGNIFLQVFPFACLPLAETEIIATIAFIGKSARTGEHCSYLSHFDNTFLTYTVMLHDWLNQPGYASLFFMSFLASTLLPLGSEWLLVMMLAGGYEPLPTVAVATAAAIWGWWRPI
jgi:hypothetical protein